MSAFGFPPPNDPGLQPPPSVVNASRYLLPSDGDDSAVMVDALTNFAPYTYPHIVLGPGTFLWNTTIPQLARNLPCRIRGAGRSLTTIKLSSAAPQFLSLNRIAAHDVFRDVEVSNLGVDCNNVGQSTAHVVVGSHIATGTNTTTSQMNVNFENWLLEDIDVFNVPYDTGDTWRRWMFAFECRQTATGEGTQNYCRNITFRRVRGNPGTQTNRLGVAASGASRGFMCVALLSDGSTNAANVWIDEILIEDCEHNTGSTPTGSQALADTPIQVGSLGTVGRVTVRRFKGSGARDTGIEIDNAQQAVVDDVELTDCAANGILATAFVAPATGEIRRQTYRNVRVKIVNYVPTATRPGSWGGNAASATSPGLVELEDCSYSSTAPNIFAGQALSFSGAGCPDVDIRNFSVDMLSLSLAPAAPIFTQLITYSGRVRSRFSLDGFFPTLAGTQTTLNKQTLYLAHVAAPSADVAFTIDRVRPDINVTGLVSGSLFGVYIGGAAASTARGSLTRFRWIRCAGDTAPVGFGIDASTALTITTAITYGWCDFSGQPGGNGVSIGDNTNRAKIFGVHTAYHSTWVGAGTASGNTPITLGASPAIYGYTGPHRALAIIDTSGGASNVSLVEFSMAGGTFYAIGTPLLIPLEPSSQIRVTYTGSAPIIRINTGASGNFGL